jgi:hypothetical protein
LAGIYWLFVVAVPNRGLVFAAIAKREIALAKSNVGWVNLEVAANITAVVILSLQVFVLLTIGFDLIELAFLLEDLFRCNPRNLWLPSQLRTTVTGKHC